MSALFKKFLQEATRLTRNGSLQEATRAIQQALGRTAPLATPPHAASPWNANSEAIDVVARPVHRAAHQPVSEPVRPIFTPAQPASNDGPGAFTEAAFTHAGTTRSYKIYAPPHATTHSTPAAQPLVLMLHGCTQNPDDFASGTGMNALALEHGFVVLYPAQNQKANAQRCWNWFIPGDQQRDTGEAAWLAALVQHVTQLRPIDPARIYVAGLSAGGAMASILGHTHPDVFAAVGVHSGLACGVANNVITALSVMKNGRSTAGAPSRLPTIVFHGDADKTVHPLNADVVLQTAIGKATTTAKVTEGSARKGQRYTRTTYQTADGSNVAENWTLHGAGHAWSGGSPKGSYTDPSGPDASAEMWRFFEAHPRKPVH